ncbi:ABC transporter ATP-binding protein [Streptomyces lunaelactis]|uniref:ABC transporter ATP-binding protein n=1 Tax=Streptomyces lunaelactis TaxID=1535768 RepID=UPI001585A6A3|nr:ABC transporter ATP-binding protein [Streptomyces lunaelactis]NUK32225.1 ABC transporter ATP-binding protein [Streptomyces lunaelactis]NUK41285.1 ABC transporter ATP-binding protein [Streptomyces lunaelactis]
MAKRKPRAEATAAAGPSESEQLLFGGPLRYDLGWNKHEEAFLQLNLRSMLTRLPHLLATTVQMAWQADKGALRLVAFSEIGRGVSQAAGLIAVNRVLAHLLGTGTTAERLTEAAPALAVAGATALVGAVLRALSTAGTGQLEPKVERVATERYLSHTANVELEAVEDEEFHKLLDSASYGASSARRMVKYCQNVINALMSLIAAAGVLAVLHPVLLPLLVAMTLPSAWAALSVARRRYTSFHVWVQHSRAGQLISRLLISTEAAPEIRVHNVGPFLLHHFRAMSQSQEAEQKRLARLAARTGLIAAGWTGLAAAAAYATLGGLLWTGAMALSVGGTAVLAIRSGSSSLDNLVLQVNYLHEESLFVGDLHRLCEEAAERAIPVGGLPLPKELGAIRFEEVVFTYRGKDNKQALNGASLTIPTGKIVALVGENGSGKSTLIKLLCGLYRPDSGRILWDDVDAAEANRQELVSRVAVVGQDFYRWPFTAAVNIGIGRPEAPMSQDLLEQAIQYAGAEELIEELPRGWQTLLARGYKGGHQLSGGQWQRLGLGRAHFRNGELLIVDEPTSALDAKAEQQLFEQIRALADAGQTVILITHRLGSVRAADLIHVLDHGRVVESGTFDELLSDKTPGPKVFRDLYQIQAAQYALDRPALPSQHGHTKAQESAKSGAR